MLSTSLKKDMLNILKKLISFNTQNPPGLTNEIIDYLISNVLKEEEGFQNEIYEFKKDDISLHNLVSKIGNGDRKIVFSGHFDTVPIGELNKWKYPPLSGEIVEGNIYGRGSADMKGGLVSIIGLLKYLSNIEKLKEKFTFIFAGTADEEAGMLGSQFLSNNTNLMDNVNLLVILEPTNLNIGIAQKGVLWARVIIHGKAAHGSMPHKGINAIEGAASLIAKLKGCLEEKQNPILGESTLNIGKINGGSVINVVPEKAEIDIDFRLIPEQSPKSLINNLKLLKSLHCRVDIQIPVQLPALKNDSHHPFITNLKQISHKEIIGLSYATDAAYLINPKKTTPFVIFGPGDPKRIHKVNEYVSLEQVYNCSEFLLKGIMKTY